MAIEDIKKDLGGGGVRERPEIEAKPERISSPPKIEKKAISPFETGSLGYRLRDPELYKTTNLGEDDRIEIAKKIFNSIEKDFDRKDAENAQKELDQGHLGRLRNLTESEKQNARQLLRGILGK